MTENSKYFVLKKKAVPEVLLKVVEAKRLLDCNPGMTVQISLASAAVHFINTKRTSFLSMMRRKERLLLLCFRWRMNRDFCPRF